MKRLLVTALAILTLSTAAPAAKLRVPADHDTIQEAIDAAADYDVILVSKGRRDANLSIVNKHYLTIQGKGRVILDAQGIGVGIGIQNSTHITLKNLRVRNAGTDGIGIASSSDVRIEKCRVEATGAHGINTISSTGLALVRNTIRSPQQNAIVMASTMSVIRDNRIEGVPQDNGVEIHSNNVSVFDNRIEDCFGVGIFIEAGAANPRKILIAGNRIEAVRTGVNTWAGAEGVSVLDNDVRATTLSGIAFGGTGHLAAGNKLKRTNYGIRTVSHNVIVGNRVDRSLEEGLSLLGPGSTLERNRVRRSKRYGVYVAVAAHDNLICFNNVKQSATYDLHDDSSPGDNEFIGNVFGTIAP